MKPLDPALRKQFEKTIIAARDLAEEGARTALERLGVANAEPPGHMPAEARQLRVALRAAGRQRGDLLDAKNKTQACVHLVEACAYEYWHRMLFARFLAENNLLIHPNHGVAVSFEEVDELAAEAKVDRWTLVGRYASHMLPQIFRPDDPILKVTFAPEHKLGLEKMLADLPRDVFVADDALGWSYQFWQTRRKEEVNAKGDKIGADSISAVTQLFTEHYMVEFLLHNTLGAWWAGKHAAKLKGCENEQECRKAVALPGLEWTYLRFVRVDAKTGEPLPAGEGGADIPVCSEFTWRPAAGTFDGWPKTAKELTVLDPCCGSGHFLVTAFDILVRMRMTEEKLDAAAACVAVLKENLFGLEIDARCTQIAAFNLAFAAWKLGGWQLLPALNVACSGLAPSATLEQWLKLADKASAAWKALPAHGREPVRNGLTNLHHLFSQAPILGSLLDPNTLTSDLLAADWETLQPFLEKALEAETDVDAHEQAVAAQGMVKAAEILSEKYTLVATNVPYLGRGKQNEILQEYCERVHPESKADLATCFIERCLNFCFTNASAVLVTPQNWLFLGTYQQLRIRILNNRQLDAVVRLGAKGFQTPMWDFNTALMIFSHIAATDDHSFMGLDIANEGTPDSKNAALRVFSTVHVKQNAQLRNPDSRITLVERGGAVLLEQHAAALAGINTGDYPRFGRFFAELSQIEGDWEFQQSTCSKTVLFAGASQIVKWCHGGGEFGDYVESLDGRLGGSWKRGTEVWGKRGIAVSQMNSLPVSEYLGTAFDSNVSAVVPNDPAILPALWCYCSSEQFVSDIRAIDQKVNVTNATITKVPFDLTHWQKVAAEKYPDGLPKPHSDDATQWLFNGHPRGSEQPLQVAVSRMLGYRWPRQSGSSFPDCPALGDDGLEKFSDDDGIVPLPPIHGEQPASERLRALLASAYGKEWSPAKLEELLTAVDCAGKSLDEWLRNHFFAQHCALFHHRPFIWQIWDGMKNGFSVLINYHTFDRPKLEKLIYTYLGDWMKSRKADQKAGVSGSDALVAAAQELETKLKLILEGEAPYDIFVRWKPLSKQPAGWEPDLNDGVRMNIRPFMTDKCDGILRKDPNIKWTKDRGKDPESAPWYKTFGGERINDHHLTLEEKRKAAERGAKK